MQNRSISVKLVAEGDNQLLKFFFEDKVYDLSLTTASAEEVKELFMKLLSQFENGEYSLIYDKEGREDLFAVVSNDYIGLLNVELNQLFIDYRDEISSRKSS